MHSRLIWSSNDLNRGSYIFTVILVDFMASSCSFCIGWKKHSYCEILSKEYCVKKFWRIIQSSQKLILTIKTLPIAPSDRGLHRYHKARVMLLNLLPSTSRQFSLFDTQGGAGDARSDKLIGMLDGGNQNYGQGALCLAAESFERSWQMRQVICWLVIGRVGKD